MCSSPLSCCSRDLSSYGSRHWSEDGHSILSGCVVVYQQDYERQQVRCHHVCGSKCPHRVE